MAAIDSSWLPLGELLVERGLLSQRQLELALQEHTRTGRRLGEVLVTFGFLSEHSLASVLLEQVGLMDANDEEPLESEPRRSAGHLAEAEPVRPIVLRVEDLPAPREASPGRVSAFEAQVEDFERRSEEIQASIAQIRGVLAELKPF